MAKKVKKPKEIDSYSHEDEKRKNNPPVGLVSSETDKINGQSIYKHDPHIDPCLSWAGKIEGTDFGVQNISLHVHERVDSRRIVAAFTKKETGPKQISLFEQPGNELPLHKAIDFYHHDQDWTNRMIAGDSLLVMNSLLQKEGMAGGVQTVYLDPPYGIKFNSNFQPFTNRTNVKYSDSDVDIPREPEMIQAFRDTWELGIHSYLSYLRNRLLLAHELLHESGSCFIQIGDENIHHAREVMDEIFGSENFFSLITFRKTSPLGASGLPGISDYIIWYAKDIKKIKYRPLFMEKDFGGDTSYTWLELNDGTRRRMTKEEQNNPELLPKDSRPFRISDLMSSGYTQTCYFDFEFEGKIHKSRKYSWKTNEVGMKRLIKEGRIMVPPGGKVPGYIRYYDDFPVQKLHNLWDDTQGAKSPIYVVQTANRVVERCILMTSDPGDLVFDPTCGSGTTAYVAEQWGRRWITCDTSRVAITLARQRLMTGRFDYFQLAHPEEGVASGFSYHTSPHVTLGSVANNERPKEDILYDKPLIENAKVRVTGPFTVEAVPCLRVRPFEGNLPKIDGTGNVLSRTAETGNQTLWREELKATGIQALGGKTLSFARVETMTATKFLNAEAEINDESGTNKQAVISFGPDFGPIEQRQVEEAIKEARSLKNKPDFVIFAAFHFDPEAAKDIDEIQWPGIQVLKVQMSVDLLTKDLRKKRSSSQSYWLIGQPDIEVRKTADSNYQVEVLGFDYYDPVSGEVTSKGSNKIAMWLLDTDYDERSLFPDQVFFPMQDSKKDWTKIAKALNNETDELALQAFSGTISLPFAVGKEKRIAVKIIDDRGIESFVIRTIK